MADTATQRQNIYKKLFLKNRKTVIVTGHSIAYRFSLESNYSNYLFRKGGNEYLFTQGISGSKMANYSTGDFATWNPLSVVTRSAVGATNIFDVTNCDLLIIWSGFNDKNLPIPLGADNSNDSLTYAGAIRNAIANYQARKPGMKIMCITENANPYEVPNANGDNIIDFRNKMISVCAGINIPCFDLYPVCGITDANKATALPDFIHPSSAFLESWVPLVLSFISANITY